MEKIINLKGPLNFGLRITLWMNARQDSASPQASSARFEEGGVSGVSSQNIPYRAPDPYARAFDPYLKVPK